MPLGNITNGYKLDYIFHLAAWTKAGDFALHHPADQWIKNQRINTNILAYWKAFQPQAKMIIMGTSCAYDPDLEKTVENYGKGNVDPDLYSYAMTKRMLETGVKAMADQYGMRYNIFIPSTLCGPNFEPNDTHFIFDLVKKMMRAKAGIEPAVLWGDGHQTREVMYVKDAVKLIIENSGRINETMNLCTGNPLSIREYVNLIGDEIGFYDVQYDESKFVGVKSKTMVPNIYYEPTDLRFVIKEMVEYYAGIM
jgi:GDP-L-fucose synthase